MRKSIYVQLIIIFTMVFLFGNAFAFIIVSGNTVDDIAQMLQQRIEQFTLDAKHAYESGDVSTQTLEELNESGFINLKFYDSLPVMTGELRLEESDVQGISGMPAMLYPKRQHGNGVLCIVQTGDKYLVARPNADKVFADLRGLLLRVTALSLIIGLLVMLLAGRFIVRPVKSLSNATGRIAAGDFSVRIPHRRRDELGQLIESFNAMAQELGSMEIMRSGFISDISHEFRTPITSIEGYTKLLRDCKSEEERNEYIDIIVEETHRLSTLSGNILLLSRIENENIPVQKTMFRLDEQIRKMLLASESSWSRKGIDLEPNLAHVIYHGNEALLYQVWANLFDNAVKFSHEGGMIWVDLTEKDGKIIFSITDHGKGMTEEEKQHMFEKFFTCDRSKNTEGNGLGLSIVRRVVDMHGGMIEVESKIGEGTTVRVVLS